MSLLIFLLSLTTSSLAAIFTDTIFYHPNVPPLTALLRTPVLIPENALRYNISTANLTQHGLHPRYTHLLLNLPQLLGPALFLLVQPLWTAPRAALSAALTLPTTHPSKLLLSAALPALAALSTAPHQEARFLLPVVPLLLVVLRLPHHSRFYAPGAPLAKRMRATRHYVYAWIVFNLVLSALFGVFHQGGVIPVQTWLGQEKARWSEKGEIQAFWWRTYSPPRWMVDRKNAAGLLKARSANLLTVDLMGMNASVVRRHVEDALEDWCRAQKDVRSGVAEALLIVPRTCQETSTWCEHPHLSEALAGRAHVGLGRSMLGKDSQWLCEELFHAPRHIGLDDMDIVADIARSGGTWWWWWLRFPWMLWKTRGLSAWSIRRQCG